MLKLISNFATRNITPLMMYSLFCQKSMMSVPADWTYVISPVGVLHCESVILEMGGGKIPDRFRIFGIQRLGRCGR